METLQDIKQTVMFEAPIQKVWGMESTSEGIASWFMPNDFKPRVGHEFHVQSPFGPYSMQSIRSGSTEPKFIFMGYGFG